MAVMILQATGLCRMGMVALARLALAGLALAEPAAATSPDAWKEFRQQVATSCAKLALARDFQSVTVEVDPFGTQSYGVALITGVLKKGLGSARAICVLDKKTGKAELGAESTGWVTISPSHQ